MEAFGEAVILCGGKSRRMRYDKSFAKINDRYVIEIIYEKLSACFRCVKLSVDAKDKLGVFGLETIEDEPVPGAGPAVGIYSALLKASTTYVFITACDMPLLHVAHIEFMKETLGRLASKPDALVPMNGAFIEPLYSFYSKDMASKIREELEKGNYKIHNILHGCDTLYLEDRFSRTFDASLTMFSNINTEADLERVSWMMR